MDTIALTGKDEMHNVMEWRLSAIIIVLVSTAMAFGLSRAESSFDIVASHTVATHSYSMSFDDPPVDVKLQGAKDILRDSFLLAWVVGGCIPGSFVGVWIRSLTKMAEIGKTFGVSLFTSFCSSPYLITRYFDSAPSTCLIVGFFVAVSSWLAWEVALIIAGRMKSAAIKNGWIGVKDEIIGNTQDVTGVPAKPAETPNVPGADGKKL